MNGEYFLDCNYFNGPHGSGGNRSCFAVQIFPVNGYVTAAITLLFFLIGLPWNALVIGTIISKKLFTNPAVMLMLNLAVSNLLMCLLVMPFTIAFGFGGIDVFSSQYKVIHTVCQTVIAITLFSFVSTHTVALMSVDRLIYLKKPLTYKFIVTPGRMFVAIVVVWLLCIGLSIPPLFGFGEAGYSGDLSTCMVFFGGESDGPTPLYAYLILLFLELSIPILVQLVMCVWIVYIARKYLLKKLQRTLGTLKGQPRANRVQNRQDDRRSTFLKKYSNKQLHLLNVFGVIVGANLLTIIPAAVFLICVQVLNVLPGYLYPIPYLLYLSRTVIHPILESILNYEIRSVMSKCLPAACVKARQTRNNSIGSQLSGSDVKVKLSSEDVVITSVKL